jgi:hypothetical protein
MGERIVEMARRRGPLFGGRFRVVTIESDDRVSIKDFDSLDGAKQYADDAASEGADMPPVAVVLDDSFHVVHRGRPYYF